MESCLEPRQVAGLSGTRVLRVSCGTFHTAAICVSLTDCAYHASVESSVDIDDTSFAITSTPQSTRKAHCGQLYTWGGVFVAPSLARGDSLSPPPPLKRPETPGIDEASNGELPDGDSNSPPSVHVTVKTVSGTQTPKIVSNASDNEVR